MPNKVEGAERAEPTISEERLAFLRDKLNAGKISLPPELLEKAREKVVKIRQQRSRESLRKQGRLPVDPHSTTIPSAESQRSEEILADIGNEPYMRLIDNNTTTRSPKVIEEALKLADEEGMFASLENDRGDEKSQVRAARGAIGKL
jgi:hypothetical protein